MQYMMLIYVDERLEEGRSEEEAQKIFEAYTRLDEELKAKNKVISAAALQPTSTATTIKVRQGKILTTDGPFAEVKEQFGGYYIIECENLDEAIEWAAKIPDAAHGTIEIRPKMVWG
ncbi:MAG: YciI family protein [Anaerolineae bacterium]|nr:YciI family protein [Anaerolineae bacterium]